MADGLSAQNGQHLHRASHAVGGNEQVLLPIWSVREPDADRCLCCRGRKQRGLASRVDAEKLIEARRRMAATRAGVSYVIASWDGYVIGLKWPGTEVRKY